MLLLLTTVSLPRINARTVYVSTAGNDSNFGSEQYPLRSIDIALKQADTILLKAGDRFYGHFSLNKKYLGRYGRGTNPTISGYKRLLSPNWELVSRNIWRLSLVQNNFSGYVTEGSTLLNNIGCIHEYDKDAVHGRKVQFFSELKENWDVWQTETYSSSMNPSTLDSLYLYFDGNPNRLKLEFAIGECAISMRYSTIERVNFEGFGFGISVLFSDNIVRGCKIDAIGGMTLLSSRNFVLHGNGIGLYFGQYSVKNCIIEGNYISRCYDCGLCLQGTAMNNSNGVNIVFRDNLVTHCCQGIEIFSESITTPFDNCIAQANYFISNGESGFGYPQSRFKRCQILENNTKGPKGFKYIDNVFVDGNFYCAATYEKNNYESSVFMRNCCFIAPGQYVLSDYYGKNDVIRIEKPRVSRKYINEEKMGQYKTMTCDYTTSFTVLSPVKIRRMKKKKVSEYLREHTY